MTNILMVLATSFTTNGMVGEFEPTEYSRIKSIISKNVRKIYADCGLRDKDAASLYEIVPASGGSFGSGRRKSGCPRCMILPGHITGCAGEYGQLQRECVLPAVGYF